MEYLFIHAEELHKFLTDLENEFLVYALFRKGNTQYLGEFSRETRGSKECPNGEMIPGFNVGGVRSPEPLKSFFFNARKQVAENYDGNLLAGREKAICLVGVKACDLQGLRILDSVFSEGGYKDPYYTRERNRTLIISADCTNALDECFCLSLHGKPYPEDGFDLNLSDIGNGYVVETGSERGRDLIKNSPLFSPALKEQKMKRENQRTAVSGKVRSNIIEHNIPDWDNLKGVIGKNYKSGLWEEEAGTCVECGACNTICPTCHCFLLYDQLVEDRLGRFRIWDSCLIKDFATVAGGANPRAKLWMRLRNRFEKKFDFFPETTGDFACTGCGRCILACPGKIDIREVLRRNFANVS
jgi:sulfhydrogenase subunit beta (sulfur reductase)